MRRLAKREYLKVGEWVRRALREALASRPATEPETKLKAIHRTVTHAFPNFDISQMLEEIERGDRSSWSA